VAVGDVLDDALERSQARYPGLDIAQTVVSGSPGTAGWKAAIMPYAPVTCISQRAGRHAPSHGPPRVHSGSIWKVEQSGREPSVRCRGEALAR
jgi:hypothetical protein